MLALSDDAGESWHTRRQPLNARIKYKNGVPVLISGWQPWPDVYVDTFLLPPAGDTRNWHVRVHHVKTGRALRTAEGAFAIHGCKSTNGRELGSLADSDSEGKHQGSAEALIASVAGAVGIIDLKGGKPREGEIVKADPNSNIVDNRTVLPSLLCDMEARSTAVLRTAIFAIPSSARGWENRWRGEWERRPTIPGWLEEEIRRV
jgi:hypothetical protein